jgi:hypothetical protein
MSEIHYHVVEHDGGWAYRLGDVYSETHPTHDDALAAARKAARAQEAPGETTLIEFEDADGKWRTELADGGDRPVTDVDG